MARRPRREAAKRRAKLRVRPRFSVRLRNYFLTGFVISAPIAITAYATWALIGWVDSWVKPYIPRVYNPDEYLPFAVPGFGLVVAMVLITLIGFFTANLIGRYVVTYSEGLLARIPFVRNVYSALKQIFETVFRDSSDSFSQVVLVEYPRKGLWALAFVATDTLGEVQARLDEPAGEQTVSVFLPTTPNPTSGFLLFVPKSAVIVLKMSVEEAAKLVISAGLVAPPHGEAKPVQVNREALIAAQ